MFAVFIPTLLLGTLMHFEDSNLIGKTIRGAPPPTHHHHHHHHRSWVGLKSDNDVNKNVLRCRTTSPLSNGFVVDDLGFRCERKSLLKDGCCPASSKQHTCDLCGNVDQNSHRCCNAYESCVSCCMGSSYNSKNLPHGVAFCDRVAKDKFAFCSCRCRTHSEHTIHENAYKSPQHYCFGII